MNRKSFLALLFLTLALSSCRSTMTKESVRESVRKRMPEFTTCYTSVLKRQPNLQGKIKFGWELDDRGQSRNVEVLETSVNSPVVENCMIEIIKKIKFAPTKPGVTAVVSYPFYLGPDPGATAPLKSAAPAGSSEPSAATSPPKK